MSDYLILDLRRFPLAWSRKSHYWAATSRHSPPPPSHRLSSSIARKETECPIISFSISGDFLSPGQGNRTIGRRHLAIHHPRRRTGSHQALQGKKLNVRLSHSRSQEISSRLVKEIALLGGDISPFTTPAVAQALIKHCKERN